MVVKTLVLGLNVPLNSEDFFSNDFNHQDVLKIFKDLTGFRGALYAVDMAYLVLSMLPIGLSF